MGRIVKLIFFVLLSQLAGIIGAVFTAPAIPAWYAGLRKPAFAPPNWLFGPVWIILYTLMGIAAFLVFEKGWERQEVKIALGIFFLQLILNALWSYLFFGLQSPLLGFVGIVFLWLAVLATILVFFRISLPAAWLLVPYLLWVSFAAILNFFILRLNP